MRDNASILILEQMRSTGATTSQPRTQPGALLTPVPGLLEFLDGYGRNVDAPTAPTMCLSMGPSQNLSDTHYEVMSAGADVTVDSTGSIHPSCDHVRFIN